MTLFTNDLYRNFGLGFLLGGVAVTLSNPMLKASLFAVIL